MNQLSARHQDGYMGESLYTGDLMADCAAVKDDLTAKIKRAITQAVDDGVIIGTGTDDDWSIGFSVDGAGQFITGLVSICTAGEKAELLYDWILDGDTKRAVEICEYLTSKHNPMDSIAKYRAEAILEHYFSHATNELIARGDA